MCTPPTHGRRSGAPAESVLTGTFGACFEFFRLGLLVMITFMTLSLIVALKRTKDGRGADGVARLPGAVTEQSSPRT